MVNLHVSALKYSLPNLHNRQYPQNCTDFDNDCISIKNWVKLMRHCQVQCNFGILTIYAN